MDTTEPTAPHGDDESAEGVERVDDWNGFGQRLTASGTRLSKDELTALLKPGPGESWAARLVRLDAASLAMPELRVERTGTAGATGTTGTLLERSTGTTGAATAGRTLTGASDR